jgi:hypothetical protein
MGSERDLNRNLYTIFAQSGKVNAVPWNMACPSCEVSSNTCSVSLSKSFRHQSDHHLPEQLFLSIAEGYLYCRIDRKNATVFIDGYDDVRCSFGHTTVMQFTRSKRRKSAFPLEYQIRDEERGDEECRGLYPSGRIVETILCWNKNEAIDAARCDQACYESRSGTAYLRDKGDDQVGESPRYASERWKRRCSPYGHRREDDRAPETKDSWPKMVQSLRAPG